MNLAWSNIRPLNGDQRLGFEELCAQLARLEAPRDSKFVRTGAPDGGVECYCILENGDEWGWQAKFFTTALQEPQWNQIDQAVERALDTHPNLERYFVCVPRDRSDGRRDGIVTEMERWSNRVDKWRTWAAGRGMQVEFEWWGSSELADLLAQEENTGRVQFWFGDRNTFSHDWFVGRLEEAITTAGERYTAEAHVDLDVTQSLEMFGRTESAVNRMRSLSTGVKKEFQLLSNSPFESHHVDGDFGLVVLRSEGARIVEAIGNLDFAPENTPDIAGVVSMIDRAVSLAGQSTDRLAAIEQSRDETPKTPQPLARQHLSPFRFQEWRTRLRRVERRLQKTRSTLLDAVPLLSNSMMILEGEAGTGKTHLLCGAAEHRRDAGMPTLLLMGQQFGLSGSPWPQLFDQLSLETMHSDQFIGAIEAAAQTAGCRALILIDALNEGRGIEIWFDHLAAFVTRVTRSSWISVLVSVRSTYLDSLIPAEVLKKAVHLEHQGFVGNESEAIQIYFRHYGLELPSGPVLMPEFRRPLFLKTICEGLRDTGQKRMPRGFHGISAIFDLYLDAMNRRVARRTDHDPEDNLIWQALERLAKQMHESRQHALNRRDARQLVDELLPGKRFYESLFQAMIAEGVLLQETNGSASHQREERILITYERFSDHVIAKHLLDTQFDDENPPAAFSESGALAFVRTGDWWLGPVEALCVQLPERYGLELFGLVPQALDNPSSVRVFLESLVWRATGAFSEDTHHVLNALTEGPKGISTHEYFDTLLTVATIPGHAFNAHHIDYYLRRFDTPNRDARWSTYLHEVYGHDTALDRILDWAASLQHEDGNRLDDDAVYLCGITLTWMLTSSNRFVRDRATKGLVTLFTGRLDALRHLLEQFDGVDDPYVAERLYAVAYGVATRCHDSKELQALASTVYESVFASGRPSPHVLLRDYARGVIERALYLGADLDVDTALIRPPYRSDWPHIPSADELESLAPRPDLAGMERFDPRSSEWAIHFSVMDDDFSIYVIGGDRRNRPWLSRPLIEKPWMDPEVQLKDLLARLPAPAQQAWRALQQEKQKQQHRSFLRSLPESARQRFANPSDERMGDERGEGSAEEATMADEGSDDHQLQTAELRQSFLSVMSPEQQEQYLAIEEALEAEPWLDPAIVRRYILWRVFDLGWTVERFGRFDLNVNWRSSRESRKPERIGKKYQWIAFHEMLAYLSDHHRFDSGDSEDPSRYRFNGPWQLSRRDIDPTAPTQELSPPRAERKLERDWWRGYEFEDWRPDLGDSKWLSLEVDECAVSTSIAVTNPELGTKWLNLRSLRGWKEPTEHGKDEAAVSPRRAWLHANAYLVDEEQADEFVRWAQEVDFMGRWMPEPQRDIDVFLGEHGWSPAYRNRYGESQPNLLPIGNGMPTSPASVILTASEYLSEAAGYDCSVHDSHSFLVPAPVLLEGMGLRWFGGGTEFYDRDGQLGAFASDPTKSEASLLVREDLLRRFLEQERLALVWAVIGEKEVFGGASGLDWIGSLKFTGAFRFAPDVQGDDPIQGSLRFLPDGPEYQRSR